MKLTSLYARSLSLSMQKKNKYFTFTKCILLCKMNHVYDNESESIRSIALNCSVFFLHQPIDSGWYTFFTPHYLTRNQEKFTSNTTRKQKTFHRQLCWMIQLLLALHWRNWRIGVKMIFISFDNERCMSHVHFACKPTSKVKDNTNSNYYCCATCFIHIFFFSITCVWRLRLQLKW